MSSSLNFVKTTVICCLIAFLYLNSIEAATDYCKLCSNHIACNNNGQFSSKCSSDAENVEFDTNVKRMILDLHNKLRNDIAQGRINGYSPAQRMAYVQWDNELAQLAKLNTRRCTFAHDACRKTERYPYAGQNIAIMGQSNRYVDTREFIQNSTMNWFNEYQYTNMNAINYYSVPKNGKQNGHFTQIVRDESDRIGCAISKFQSNGFYQSYLVCNYAVTNILNEPVYHAGSTGSGCKTGANQMFKGLCGPNEMYN